MDATYFCISGDNAEDVAAMKDVPLGVPIDGTSVALMDDFSLPVAAGSTGVIHIAGRAWRGVTGRLTITEPSCALTARTANAAGSASVIWAG